MQNGDRKRGKIVTCSVTVPSKYSLNFMLTCCKRCRLYCKEKPQRRQELLKGKGKTTADLQLRKATHSLRTYSETKFHRMHAVTKWSFT